MQPMQVNTYSPEGLTVEDAHHVVIFHYPCQDGMASAVIASYYLPRADTFFWGCNYNVEFQEEWYELLAGKQIYILDFSFPLEVLQKIAEHAQGVVVCDHHLSFRQRMVAWGGVWAYRLNYPAVDVQKQESRDWTQLRKLYIKEFPSTTEIWFHDAYCGAEIAFRFFDSRFGDSNKVWTVRPLHEWINYIGDRDLWRWTLPHSKEFHAYLSTFEFDLGVWRGLFLREMRSKDDWMPIGAAILRGQGKRVEQACRRAFLHTIGGYEVPVVNASTDISEIGHRLTELYPEAPFAAVYFDLDGEERKWSLRGRSSDDFDVSAIARTLGGGGHQKAAGFSSKAWKPAWKKEGGGS